MTRTSRKLGTAFLLAAAMLLITTGADHRDAPTIDEDAAADINDVYAFVNGNNGNVVLAMTINPLTAPGVPVGFSPDVLYQFKIDNTGDAVEDLVIQATFTKLHSTSATDPTLLQEVSVVGPQKPSKAGALNKLLTKPEKPAITGAANGTVITDSSGIKVFAGRRDDPFFLDFVFVVRLTGLAPGGPLTRAPGIDFFAGLNVSILAVEIPPAMLKGSLGDIIKIWGTTSRANSTKRSIKADDKNGTSFVQIERMGLPLINTVLIQDNVQKDLFNKAVPAQDKELFTALSIANLTKLGDATTATALAGALLPDVLTLNVTSTNGFSTLVNGSPALNGRRPEDDVVDTELQLITSNAVTGDAVNANDKPFLTDFPFFAPDNPAANAVPARN